MSKSSPLNLASFTDRYQSALLDIIKAKVAGTTLVLVPRRENGRVVNLMDALRQNVAQAGGKVKPAPSRNGEDTVIRPPEFLLVWDGRRGKLRTLSLVATTFACIIVELLDKTSPCSAAKWCQQPLSGQLRRCSSKTKSKARSVSSHTASHTWCR